jgi:uncharacterized protein YjbJ (UPF0337 family)
MNTDIIEGSWKQLTGEAQKHWGKLTNDQLAAVNGNRKSLSGLLQKNYGIARDEAEKQIEEWEKSLRH